MRLPSNAALFVAVISAAGCSSLSLPSVPSIPWFSSAPKVDPTAEGLFEEGTRAFNEKKYVRAIDNFTKLRTDNPFSPLVTQAELKIADAYYLNQQYPEAINAFKEFESMHPTNEHVPFVTLRLGQAHFDQFTSTDRDQKTTEIAKGYFETVVTKYPKSPQAAEAQVKLAKAIEYLAEAEFNVADFYFKQERYSAARDRFEEIIRKYKDTPTAVKSLFYLGESYRLVKNGARAALAYEALIQHYPQSKFAGEARTQLAAVEKEKQDPLALLLMRDRRPGAVAAPEAKEDPALAKLRDLNLVAKKDVVHEEPGDEKGFLRRFADKINPFSSSDDDRKADTAKKVEKKPVSGLEMLTQRSEAQKQESGGIFSSLWPFGGKDSKDSAKTSDKNPGGVVTQVDEALKQKGIDAQSRQAALQPPKADLPKPEPGPAPTKDPVALLSSIDANLQKSGKNATELPPTPESAPAFRDAAAAQAAIARAGQNASRQEAPSSSILSSIDQKLKAQGVEPGNFAKPPSAEEIKAAAGQKPQSRNVELEPKLVLEKGPLFLKPTEIQPAATTAQETKKPEAKPESASSPSSVPSRSLVKGPVQTQTTQTTTNPAEAKKPTSSQDEAPKGVFDQMRQDMENVGKVLNPFRW
ncbi:MAG: outer membrane protein assembly factor BamD [Deltaproteobacteria bacterium]|nr:outer membrane protein assembly factor BamD [Deltaproteobacteria bacterium]